MNRAVQWTALFWMLLVSTHALAEVLVYQGQLSEQGVLFSGNKDFYLRVIDADSVTVSEVIMTGVPVSKGQFQLEADFPGWQFDGQAYRLEIALRPSGSNDAWTVLLPRIAITALPQAQYATAAADNSVDGQAMASGLQAVETDGSIQRRITGTCPSGSFMQVVEAAGTVICVPDGQSIGDVTGIQGGEGVTVVGNSGDVTVSLESITWQARIGTGCASGSTVRSIAADGSVVCQSDNVQDFQAGEGLKRENETLSMASSPLPAEGARLVRSGLSQTVEFDFLIGRDGLPVVSYFEPVGGDLRLFHCDDHDCNTGSDQLVDSTGVVGEFNALTLGRTGLPVIAYYDRDNGNLKLALCQNESCSSATIQTVDSAGDVGAWVAMTTTKDGYAVMAYHDAGNGSLKLARCETDDCSSASFQQVDTAGNVGEHVAITRNVIGSFYIAYHDVTQGDLKVAYCHLGDCSTPTINVVDGKDLINGVEENVGIWVDVLLMPSAAGPLLVYTSVADQAGSGSRVYVAQCTSGTCASANVSQLYRFSSSGYQIQGTSITRAPDGRPLISYALAQGSRLYLEYCQDTACSSTLLLSQSVAGSNVVNSRLTYRDGRPLLMYQDSGNQSLFLNQCGNNWCIPYQRLR